ncbi:HAD family hydrolase [Candidatus Margulisiibacteriota bacterium]
MIKLVTFDVDNTLTVGTSIWEQFYIEIGTWDKIGKKYLNMFYEKKITFEEFIKLDVGAYGGKHEDVIYQAAGKLKYIDGIWETVNGLREKGIKTAIVSGTIGQFAKYLQKLHGFDFCYANMLLVDKNKILTGELELTVPAYHKDQTMRKLKKDLNLKREEVLAIGDSEMDFSMFKEAGTSVCVEHAPQVVKDRVDHILPDKDLRELLKLSEIGPE